MHSRSATSDYTRYFQIPRLISSVTCTFWLLIFRGFFFKILAYETSSWVYFCTGRNVIHITMSSIICHVRLYQIFGMFGTLWISRIFIYFLSMLLLILFISLWVFQGDSFMSYVLYCWLPTILVYFIMWLNLLHVFEPGFYFSTLICILTFNFEFYM